MEVRKLIWMAAACTALPATLIPVAKATAQEKPSAAVNTVRLVHGARADGSSWSNDPKVAGLVYVSAVAPDQGESTIGLISFEISSRNRQLVMVFAKTPSLDHDYSHIRKTSEYERDWAQHPFALHLLSALSCHGE